MNPPDPDLDPDLDLGCAQVKGQSQLQNLRQSSSASPGYDEPHSMLHNHRESRSLQNPLQENPLQQNPLQEISSLLEVCGEALDPPGGCWCLPTPAQLRPTEVLCEVRSGPGAVVVVRSELTSDSLFVQQMKTNLEMVTLGKTGDQLSMTEQARLYLEP